MVRRNTNLAIGRPRSDRYDAALAPLQPDDAVPRPDFPAELDHPVARTLPHLAGPEPRIVELVNQRLEAIGAALQRSWRQIACARDILNGCADHRKDLGAGNAPHFPVLLKIS